MAARTYVGFVRAVMHGRDGLHRHVLVHIVEQAGGRHVRTHLTTGNISFTADPDDVDRIVTEVESGIEAVVGRPTPVIIRTLEHLVGLIDRRPFAEAPHPDPRARLVAMVRDRVRADLEVPIVSPHGDHHVFAVDGGDVFSITVDTGGRVQDPGGLIERLAGEPVTSRALGTIETIVRRLRDS